MFGNVVIFKSAQSGYKNELEHEKEVFRPSKEVAKGDVEFVQILLSLHNVSNNVTLPSTHGHINTCSIIRLLSYISRYLTVNAANGKTCPQLMLRFDCIS